MTSLPQTLNEAKCFAAALREFVLGDEAAVDGDCLSAVRVACMISDEIETYFGTINGIGHHVAIVNGYLVDVTADQFGDDFDGLVVLPIDQIDGTDYGAFRESNFRGNYCGGRSAMPMTSFWELVEEFEVV